MAERGLGVGEQEGTGRNLRGFCNRRRGLPGWPRWWGWAWKGLGRDEKMCGQEGAWSSNGRGLLRVAGQGQVGRTCGAWPVGAESAGDRAWGHLVPRNAVPSQTQAHASSRSPEVQLLLQPARRAI